VSSTPASSSVPSVSSAYANVTSVTLSAASNLLTQVLGSQRTVSVSAVLNANTNPNLALEWFVNGVKQPQTGRIFDFTPVSAGSFALTAKVGNLNSNTINLTVGLPTIAIQTAEFVSATVIELKADAGASVSLTGAELLPTSFYDLAKGVYVLNLKAAAKQGDSVVVRLERAGFATETRAVIFDTQVFKLDSVTLNDSTFTVGFDLPLVNGVYQIVKPLDENINKTVKISLEQENMLSTVATNYSFETTVPTGATAVTPQNQLLTGSNATVLAQEVVINEATTPGLYTHKITVGRKTVEVKVNVLDSKPEILLAEGLTDAFRADVDEDFAVEQYSAKVFPTSDSTDIEFLTPNANGIFVITKPFETMLASGTNFLTAASVGKEFNFQVQLLLRNFAESEVPGINNQYSITLEGPSEVGGRIALSNMPYEGTTQLILPSFQNFGSAPVPSTGTTAIGYAAYTYGTSTTSSLLTLTQLFDRTTTAGDYVFTIQAGQVGSEINKQITVRLLEPTAKLDFVVNGLEVVQGTTRMAAAATLENGRVVISKPSFAGIQHNFSFFTVLQNHYSKVATQEEQVVDTVVQTKKDKKLFPYTDVSITEAEAIRMGNLGSVTTQAQTGTQTGIFHKYVNFSLEVSGPSALLAPVTTKKLALLPGDNTDSLVVYNATGFVVKASAFEDYLLDTVYDSYDLGTTFPTPISDFLRSAITINSLTVVGTYRLTFKVDNLVTTVDLVIQEPQASLNLSSAGLQFVPSGTVSFAVEGDVWKQGGGTTAAPGNIIYGFFNNQWNKLPTDDVDAGLPTVTKLNQWAFDTTDSTGEKLHKSVLSHDAGSNLVVVADQAALFASETRALGAYYFQTDTRQLFRVKLAIASAAVSTAANYELISTLPAANVFNITSVADVTALQASGTRVVGDYYLQVDNKKIYRVKVGVTSDVSLLATNYEEVATDTAASPTVATALARLLLVSEPNYGDIIVSRLTEVKVFIVNGETFKWNQGKTLTASGYSGITNLNSLPSVLNADANNAERFVLSVDKAQELAGNVDFSGLMRFANITAGSYNYSVKVTLPDGTVDNWNDTATVAAAAAPSLSIGLLSSPPVSAAPGITFSDKWNRSVVTGAKIGTYTYEFTFGSLSKKMSIVVQENPKFNITRLTATGPAGSLDTQVLPVVDNNTYVLSHKLDARIYTISAAGTLSGLNAEQFYNFVLGTPTTAADLNFSADDLYSSISAATASTLTPSLKGVTAIPLGKIATVALTTAESSSLTYNLNFFNKVPVSVSTTTGVVTYAFEQVGPSQVIKVVAVNIP
jgi:hypothetical protein